MLIFFISVKRLLKKVQYEDTNAYEVTRSFFATSEDNA